MQNHVIDPTFFNDAIDEFAFTYTIYVVDKNSTVDEYGRRQVHYSKQSIYGSLQNQGLSVTQSTQGNIENLDYKFYCSSVYRINIGDIIEYKDNYLRVNSVNDYDEWGVRSASLTTIQLSTYRDFADYLKYINGEKIV